MALLDEALQQFRELFDGGMKLLREPAAMSLATADRRGRPSVRTVLLKRFDREGFVFYTNTASRKGRELAENPYAAICIYWQDAHRQAQVSGFVEKVSDKEADDYWRTRSRGSQLGAWSSRQSMLLQDRSELLSRFEEYKKKFAGKKVPRPDFWTGYRLQPDLIEFWQGHPDRLNRRVRYYVDNGDWKKTEVFP